MYASTHQSRQTDDPTVTVLYVPADRRADADRAMASAADVVVLDLEDGVAAEAKGTARSMVPHILRSHPARRVWVRVNSPAAACSVLDLAMVAKLPRHVEVCVPKVDSPVDIRAVSAIATGRRIHCLLETATGVEAARQIAHTPGVASVALGEADLAADLGITDDDALNWCRQRVVVAARAAALPPPVMSAYFDVHDEAGLFESTRRGWRQGFIGRAAVDLAQLPIIERAFVPEAREVSRAREIVAAAEAELADDYCAQLDDGFVDVGQIVHARRVLSLAERGA